MQLPYLPIQMYILNTLSFQDSEDSPLEILDHPVPAYLCPCVYNSFTRPSQASKPQVKQKSQEEPVLSVFTPLSFPLDVLSATVCHHIPNLPAFILTIIP